MVTNGRGTWSCALACVVMMACGGGDDAPVVPDAGAAPDAAIEVDAELNGNATLAGLTTSLGTLDPPFEPDVTTYHLDLVLAETEVSFMATAAVPSGVAIMVEGEAVSSGSASSMLALAPGTLDVEIAVTAANNAIRTYHVHVHRGVDALASLTSPGALTPAFDSATRSYTLGVGTATASVAVTPTLLCPGRAAITVNGTTVASGAASQPIAVAMGSNAVTVAVTPSTRPAQSTSLAVLRGADALSGIQLSHLGGELSYRLSPAFDPATTSYTIDVGLWAQALQVTVATTYAGATVTVAGNATVAGVPAAPVPLNLGLTTIPIVVTTGDGTERTYTLAVTRASQALQQAYAKASNTGANDQFGQAVAIWGDTLAVAAEGEDSSATGVGGNQADNSAGDAGAVYVFTRNGATWSQQAYLKASNTAVNDRFGSSYASGGGTVDGSIALWRDTLVVGAPGEDSLATGVNGNQADNNAGDAGAAYVFTRTGTTWSQQAYLKASNTAQPGGSGDQFGGAVAVYGDTVAVGARFEDSNAAGTEGQAADSGAVYVFTRTGTTWSQQAYLKASNFGFYDEFGRSLALWGDTLAVGAHTEDSAATGVGGNQADEGALASGAAYVFTRAGTAWSQQAYVKASNTDPGDRFGQTIALSGDTLAIGAQFEGSAATGINGNQADNTANQSGAVYVFARSGTTWSQQAYVKASNSNALDYFGSSVALWGGTLAVGARYEASSATGIGGTQSDNALANAGAVYLFQRAGTSWSQQAYVKASNTGSDLFGASTALWHDTLVVCAPQEASAATGVGGDQTSNAANASGAVYVFR